MSGCWSLLPLAAPVSRRIELEDLKGAQVGIAANSWLNRFVRAHAADCCRGVYERTVTDFLLRADSLRCLGVSLIIVFDGVTLPMKREAMMREEEERAKEARLAEELVERNYKNKAGRHLLKSVQVTRSLIECLVKTLTEAGFRVIFAPSEASAQLVYFAREGSIGYIATEDPEIMCYRVPCPILMRWSTESSSATVISQDVLWKFLNQSHENVRLCCCLSGTSFVRPASNLGFIALLNMDQEQREKIVQELSPDSKRDLEVAILAYDHLLVFDMSCHLVDLNPDGSSSYFGPVFTNDETPKLFSHGKIPPAEVDAVCKLGPELEDRLCQAREKETEQQKPANVPKQKSPKRGSPKHQRQMDITSFFHVAE